MSGTMPLGVSLLLMMVVTVRVVVIPTVEATAAVCMLSVLWKTLGKVRMPPTRPGKLSCLAVMMVVHPWVILGRILGLGPVRLKTTVPGVTAVMIDLLIAFVEMLTQMLVL